MCRLQLQLPGLATLMTQTVINVWVSRIDLGALNTRVAMAMAIAIVNATVVILWFMHVIHSPLLTWIVVNSSFLLAGCDGRDVLRRLREAGMSAELAQRPRPLEVATIRLQ